MSQEWIAPNKPSLPEKCRIHGSAITGWGGAWSNGKLTDETVEFLCGKCRAHIIFVGAPANWELIERGHQ